MIMWCVNKDSLTSFLPIQMPFISCLITLTRTSSTMLNRSGKSKPPLVPDLKSKAFSSLPLSVMLSAEFS